MNTVIVVDSKLMAYNASYQRKDSIIATIDSIENAIKFMVNSGMVVGSYEVIIGFDYGKSRHRKELLASYKGHRQEGLKEKPKAEQLLYDNFQSEYRNLLPELVVALGVRVVGVNNVEFDDLGSIIAHKYYKDTKVILLTEDHDFFQLPLSLKNVFQFLPKSYRLLDYDDVVEIEEVTDKAEFLIKKTILGDSGDSIRGLYMCGKKCFDAWFPKYKGLDFTLDKWKSLFIELANSEKAYKIHKDYVVTTFSEMFDLNIALGTTMCSINEMNKKEQREFLECFKTTLSYNLERFKEIAELQSIKQLTDFGDPISIQEYPYLRGLR